MSSTEELQQRFTELVAAREYARQQIDIDDETTYQRYKGLERQTLKAYSALLDSRQKDRQCAS